MVGPLDQRVSGGRTSLTLGHQPLALHQRVHGRPNQVGLPLGSLGNRLKAARVLLVVELIFDDAEQALVELQQRFDLALVLGVQLLLAVDLL